MDIIEKQQVESKETRTEGVELPNVTAEASVIYAGRKTGSRSGQPGYVPRDTGLLPLSKGNVDEHWACVHDWTSASAK